MNVLLAEANVEYPKLIDLEEANELLNQADVVLVLGANDVVNPAQKMMLRVQFMECPYWKFGTLKLVVVVKRSMGSGYAG
jgi:NAD(P) transhydrogenase subunit beta